MRAVTWHSMAATTAQKPREPAQQLARLMHARYLALPRSGIAALPDIVMGRA